ncbi:MAG: hypothetical protein VX768_00895 [Planctomycetota bacterium]|nr:hypothetical protein [Planctomycetota bacterium]
MQKLNELLNHPLAPYVFPILISLAICGGYFAIMFNKFVFVD